MECTHGKLGTGFPDGLCGDDAECVADFGESVAGEVAPIALHAYAVFRFACKCRADQNAGNTALSDQVGDLRSELFAGGDKETTVGEGGVFDISSGEAADNAVAQRHNDFIAVDDTGDAYALDGTTVFAAADNILSHVDEFTGHVT